MLDFLAAPRARRSRRALAAPILVALAGALSAASADAQPSLKQIRAARLIGHAPHIDGKLDDAAWRSAVMLDDFVDKRPVEGVTPSERTEIAFLYDDEALYVAARLHRRDPSHIPASVSRRDGFGGNSEVLVISLDTYLDRRTAYSFGVTSSGVRVDYHHPQDDEMNGREYQFDPVWEARSTIDSTGWSAEMRIPFSQLRFTAANEQVWGLSINRWIPDKNEDIYWVMIPGAETGFASRFGTLRGIVGVKARRPVEVTPYIAADATRRGSIDARDPFGDPAKMRAGADVKVGIGSNLTLDGTVNPDFGQVEADPAEVNLTGFETFFPERRPFFIEGAQMFQGIGPSYFYSRRVGGAPHLQPDADFIDSPGASTILGATKITGRFSNKLSLAALASVTRGADARTFDSTASRFTRLPVEPRTAYAVTRMQQEIGRQQSTIGATFTTVQRDLGSDTLRSLLPSDAVSGGGDFRLRWKEGEYELTGWAGFSRIAGDAAAIANVQRSSAHYFQRPDASYLRYDSLATSMSGYTASIRADKNAGKRILWGAQISTRSPGFEINDVGRMNTADDIDYNADIQIRETQPGRYLRDWRLGFVTVGGWDYGHERTSQVFSQNTSTTFLNFWNLNVHTAVRLRAQSDSLTRGGPSMGTPRGWSQEYRLSSNFAAKTSWHAGGGFATNELGGWQRFLTGGVSLRPAPAWQLSLEPMLMRQRDAQQYVTTLDGGSALTYGGRYIFGVIDRTTLVAPIRVSYAFSPDLTLEGYAEPFAANGHYHDIGELSAARSRALRTYGTQGTSITPVDAVTYRVTDGASTFDVPNGDFNVLSFRSNAVLRWEWLPGSTLFLVWQQRRLDDETLAGTVRPNSLWRSVRSPGDNFLSVKVSYWLAL